MIEQTLNNLNALNSYINTNISYKEDYSFCLKEMERLSEAIARTNLFVSIDLYRKIIKENKVIEKNLKMLVEGNLYPTFLEELKGNKVSVFLSNMVETYCIMNNIDIDIPKDYDNETLSHYYQLTRKSVLTSEEVNILASRVAQGDEEARNTLIERNLGLTVYIAKMYLDDGIELIDLIQEGNAGLIKAVDTYNPAKGCRFSTYAFYLIRQKIILALANQGNSVRLPMHAYEKLKKYKKVFARLLVKLNREPTVEEMANMLNMSLQETALLCKLQYNTISLEKPIKEESTTTVKDTLSDPTISIEDETIARDTSTQIEELLHNCNLNSQEKDIIFRRNGFYGETQTLDEISQVYHFSRERVRQIEKRALYKLRACTRIKSLAIYMDDPDQAEQNANKFCEEYISNKKEERKKRRLSMKKKEN